MRCFTSCGRFSHQICLFSSILIMDGVKYSPNLLGINCAAPSCQTAIKLLVVPRSIPIANVALSIAFNLSGKRVYRIKNTTLWRGDLYQCHARRKYSSIIFVNSGRSPSSLMAKSRKKHRPVACVSGPVNETPAGSGKHNRVRESENGQNQSTRGMGIKQRA